MLRNSYKYLSAMALASLFSLAACGDDDDTTVDPTCSDGIQNQDETGVDCGGATCNACDGGEFTCTQACEAVYDCGSADNGMLCPAFVPGGVDKASFVNGPNGNDGCAATCEGNPLLINLVDPDDCPTTVQNLSGASTTFKDSCEGNMGTGGGGGAGGAGGGNAGGNGGSGGNG